MENLLLIKTELIYLLGTVTAAALISWVFTILINKKFGFGNGN